MTTTTTTLGPLGDVIYKKVSACPQCGAPVYLPCGEHDNPDVMKTAPGMAYFTCWCRLAQSIAPQPYVIPQVPNPFPPGVNPIPGSTDPWKLPNTWIVTSQTVTQPKMNFVPYYSTTIAANN